MRLNNRLRRLEHQLPEPGCPACRDRRGRTVLVTSRWLPDGSSTTSEYVPVACADCGEVPEAVVYIVEVVVRSREDVARLGEEVRAGIEPPSAVGRIGGW